jgi:hypothetical protein
MDKKELIAFIKENLRIDAYSGINEIEVSLYLGDECISISTDEMNYVTR